MTGVEDGDGRDSRWCGAKKRDGSGDPCHRPAGWGTDHPGFGRCKLHGGSTGDHRAAAQRQQAELAVVTFGLPREMSPQDALLEEVHRAAGAVAWLQVVVGQLEADDVVWGRAEQVEKGSGEFPGTDMTLKAAVNVWVDLYQRERKHLVEVCKVAIASGIEERRVRLAEQQGALLASVIRAVLDELDLTPEQAARVPDVVPRQLRAAVEHEAGGAA